MIESVLWLALTGAVVGGLIGLVRGTYVWWQKKREAGKEEERM